jgi:glyoxylase-like metal-dependent hydrolase (beta-lactamase superfamily II)
MKRWLKRGLKIVGGLVLLLGLLIGGVAYSAFGGMSSIEDNASPAPAVRIVKDGIVDVGVVDAGDGKIVLVDAGNDKTGKPILAELARRRLGPEAVAAVFLTHGHPDHIAGAHLFPTASVYCLEGDVALAEGREGSHGPITQLFGAKPSGLHITRGLHDDETVEVGNIKVRVLAIPGHTAGSAAYLVDGVLFLGDSAGMTSDGRLVGSVWALSDDSAQNRASLKALADRLRPEKASIAAIVPAHTGTGGFSALDAFR